MKNFLNDLLLLIGVSIACVVINILFYSFFALVFQTHLRISMQIGKFYNWLPLLIILPLFIPSLFFINNFGKIAKGVPFRTKTGIVLVSISIVLSLLCSILLGHLLFDYVYTPDIPLDIYIPIEDRDHFSEWSHVGGIVSFYTNIVIMIGLIDGYKKRRADLYRW